MCGLPALLSKSQGQPTSICRSAETTLHSFTYYPMPIFLDIQINSALISLARLEQHGRRLLRIPHADCGLTLTVSTCFNAP